MIPGKP